MNAFEILGAGEVIKILSIFVVPPFLVFLIYIALGKKTETPEENRLYWDNHYKELKAFTDAMDARKVECEVEDNKKTR